MTTKYPEAFIEQALAKAFSRGGRSITTVADELNVNHHTLRYWMKNKSLTAGAAVGAKEKLRCTVNSGHVRFKQRTPVF